MGALVRNSLGKPHWRCMSMRARCRTRQYSGEKVAAFSASASGMRPAVAFLQPPNDDQRLKIVHKVEQLVLLAISDDGPKDLLHEAPDERCVCPSSDRWRRPHHLHRMPLTRCCPTRPVWRACCLLSSVALTTVSHRFVCQ